MHHKSETVQSKKGTLGDIAGICFGVISIGLGLINLGWGNDPVFGAFIIIVSLVYFPQVRTIIRRLTGITIPEFVKIIIGVFILWATLGVGELFDKIQLMLKDFR